MSSRTYAGPVPPLAWPPWRGPEQCVRLAVLPADHVPHRPQHGDDDLLLPGRHQVVHQWRQHAQFDEPVRIRLRPRCEVGQDPGHLCDETRAAAPESRDQGFQKRPVLYGVGGRFLAGTLQGEGGGRRWGNPR
jgi:hypothetical protein